jgi:hypothetical protein
VALIHSSKPHILFNCFCWCIGGNVGWVMWNYFRKNPHSSNLDFTYCLNLKI